jgi:2-polyprenyl-3-methyl-5-hydroxy-6-metoxy-1,4-benzoquinol methylase
VANERDTHRRLEMANATRPAKGNDMLPPCPITGKPARRRIHGVSARVVEDIWRYAQGVNVKHLFNGVDRVTLFESPTGLVFFEPRIVGDGDFYQAYYDKWDVYGRLDALADTRCDFKRAAEFIEAGAKVVDVGCGPGVFRRHLNHAHYSGLDPYAGSDADDVVIRETLEAHAETMSESYDVATAFHVIEHVPDPRRHAELMVRLLKPGGLLILAAPLYPSPLSEIPNLPMNIPPHHVTWWNPSAFAALAAELGLEVIETGTLPPSPHQGLIYWLHRLLMKRTDGPPRERFIAHRWSWHLSIALAYPLAKIACRLRTLPPGSRPVDAFLVARKPERLQG